MIAVRLKPTEARVREQSDFLIKAIGPWFQQNPKRIICKIGWFDGASVDVRRENYREKIERKMREKLAELGYSDAKAEGGRPC